MVSLGSGSRLRAPRRPRFRDVILPLGLVAKARPHSLVANTATNVIAAEVKDKETGEIVTLEVPPVGGSPTVWCQHAFLGPRAPTTSHQAPAITSKATAVIAMGTSRLTT